MASASNSIGTKTMNISLDNKRKPQPQKTTQLDTKSNRSPVNSIPTLTHDQPHSGGIFVASSYISVKVPDGLSPVTTSRSIESSTCGTNNNTATENDGVWSSNDSADERLKLREFWQQLDQDYKEKLLMMEREDLLLKMNNHRRHGSHCFLCGKKRMIIEKEIKNVYEIYCNELDRSRNQQQPQSTSTCVANTQDTSCTRSHHHLLGTEKTDPQHNQDKPIVDTPHHDTSSLPDSKKAPLDMLTYFHLRNGITLKNDMLTVSDELLKNNGEPLMHMMDLLAEQRLDELRYSKEQENGDDKQMDDMCDEYRDYDNEDNEYACDSPHAEEEEDHVDININIFKIFVAKLFEQRVLFAYREKVAQKRQEQLLQELDKEDQCQKEQSLKKQRDIEKKKERKRLLKQKKEDERLAEERQRRVEQEVKELERKRKDDIGRQKQEAERQRKQDQHQRRQQKRLEKERRQKEKDNQQQKQHDDLKPTDDQQSTLMDCKVNSNTDNEVPQATTTVTLTATEQSISLMNNLLASSYHTNTLDAGHPSGAPSYSGILPSSFVDSGSSLLPRPKFLFGRYPVGTLSDDSTCNFSVGVIGAHRHLPLSNCLVVSCKKTEEQQLDIATSETVKSSLLQLELDLPLQQNELALYPDTTTPLNVTNTHQSNEHSYQCVSGWNELAPCSDTTHLAVTNTRLKYSQFNEQSYQWASGWDESDVLTNEINNNLFGNETTTLNRQAIVMDKVHSPF